MHSDEKASFMQKLGCCSVICARPEAQSSSSRICFITRSISGMSSPRFLRYLGSAARKQPTREEQRRGVMRDTVVGAAGVLVQMKPREPRRLRHPKQSAKIERAGRGRQAIEPRSRICRLQAASATGHCRWDQRSPGRHSRQRNVPSQSSTWCSRERAAKQITADAYLHVHMAAAALNASCMHCTHIDEGGSTPVPSATPA